MTKNKVKRDIRIIKSDREILTGTLEEDRAYTLTIEIPGRGKVNIKISFEKEIPYLSLKERSYL
ncbi:unnamed protein product [marine sediment metagenome]|uniref:Uncharacterized protein n=1 Tax=marine sediment metagenome TaxID=412755 RepID=X1VP92_9ZZZZ